MIDTHQAALQTFKSNGTRHGNLSPDNLQLETKDCVLSPGNLANQVIGPLKVGKKIILLAKMYSAAAVVPTISTRARIPYGLSYSTQEDFLQTFYHCWDLWKVHCHPTGSFPTLQDL